MVSRRDLDRIKCNSKMGGKNKKYYPGTPSIEIVSGLEHATYILWVERSEFAEFATEALAIEYYEFFWGQSWPNKAKSNLGSWISWPK